jgi:phosphomannomutase/phosphoglucomutase
MSAKAIPLNRMILAVALVFILVGATGVSLYMLMNRTSADSALLSLKDSIQIQANSINTQVELLLNDMQKTARKFEIIEAVSDKTDSGQRVLRLASQMQDDQRFAVQVALIPHGQAENFPLSFAEMEQVKRTEKGETVPVEAILGPEGEWYFIMAVPVWDKAKELIEGTLFISYKLDRIKLALDAFDHSHGSSSLIQVFDHIEPRIIFTVGKQKPEINPEHMLPIANSRWQLLFTPTPEFYKQQGMDPTVLIGILIALGVILSIVVIFLLRSAKISTGSDIFGGEHAPIQIASAKNITKGGKADASRVSDLATQATREDDYDDFNDISDPLFQHGDVMEVSDFDEVAEESAVDPSAATTVMPVAQVTSSSGSVHPGIFRDYDIRGDAQLYLGDDVVFSIGQAIGSEAQARGQTRIAVAADGRLSSPRIKEKLIEGILATGSHVIDIGNVPSPVLYFVTETTDIHSGVVVTASHNIGSDNGFKIILKGETLADDAIQSLQNRIQTGNFSTGQGSRTSTNYTDAYMEKITSDIALADNLKVVIDCGNGIAGAIAPKLLQELGCDVIPLFCEVDGNFPNHSPDPSIESNLKWLVDKVRSEKADLGVALDGDGDRLVAVSPSGKIILPDRLLMLFAKDVVSRNPGTDVIFDVKCTRRLSSLISGYGGRPLMWKSGHAHIKAKMKETAAMLGGELSGHIFFKERWYGFDDGLYAAARLLEILTIRSQNLDAALSSLPISAITPEIRLPVADEEKFEMIDKLINKGDWSGGKITTLDGLRVDFAKGWGLVRASNTNACLSLRFEADNDEMLEKIRDLFRQQLKAQLPGININF